MKTFSLFLYSAFTLILFTIIPISGLTVYASTTIFTRSLKIGMTGEDVRQLQKILNISSDTQIAEVGPGSPGQETAYFGPMTAKAVVLFQEKYEMEILSPNGLSSGTGFVGVATRVVLNRLQDTKVISDKTDMAPSPTISNIIPTPSLAAKINPNEKNLDTFLSTIDTVAQKNGTSGGVSTIIKDQIRKDIATSTNLQDTFINIIKKQISSSLPSLQTSSFIDDYAHKLVSSFKISFFPKKVQAQVGTDFGGALLFSFYCNCSANWLLTITPLPPTFATLLTYQTGSQIFLSNNIPITTWLLGKYQPGAGICLIYVGTGCASVPSEGMVTPFVGSSPI